MNKPKDWHVIIVDDEPHNLGVIELVLTHHEAVCYIADSGQRCLELLETVDVNLLLIDIQMPEMSGFDLLNIIRNHPDWRYIKAIAVTAHAMPGDRERILYAGFDGYIPKPIAPMSFIQEIQNILLNS